MNPFEKHIQTPLFTCMSIALFLLLYVLQSTNGDTWVASSLVWSKHASVLICLCALCLGALEKSKALVFGTIGLVVVWILGSSLGVIGCALGGLSGGYHRIGNCGQEISIYCGVLVCALVIFILGRTAFLLVAISAAMLPFGFAGINFYLSRPLERIVSSADQSVECFIRQPNWQAEPFDKATATRVRSAGDLQLGYVIGERSPRIYRLIGNEAHIWKFAKMQFVPNQRNGLAQFCVEDN